MVTKLTQVDGELSSDSYRYNTACRFGERSLNHIHVSLSWATLIYHMNLDVPDCRALASPSVLCACVPGLTGVTASLGESVTTTSSIHRTALKHPCGKWNTPYVKG
jgi:hypothetical protein